MALTFQKKLVISFMMILMAQAFQSMARQFSNGDAIVEKHAQWMAQHGRTYRDNAEKERRFQIFKKNLEHIERFNNDPNMTYKLGLNKFADLTNEEFAASYASNTIPPLPTTTKTNGFSSDSFNQQGEVPMSIDWRTKKGVVTSVKDQGPCESCWAFTAAAAVEGIVRNGVSLSAQQLVDCVSDNSGCSTGWMNNAFKYIIQNKGIASETDYPYQAKNQTCRLSSSYAGRISGFVNVNLNDEQALKRAVAMQPVSVSIDAVTNSNFQLYSGGVFPAQGCGIDSNHAVTLVGYGTTQDGAKYWIAKNSWGLSWGENGYMKLQRDNVGSYYGAPCGITLHASYPTLN